MVQAVLSGDYVGGSFGPIPMLNLASKGVPMYSLAMDGFQTPTHPAGAIMVRPDDTSIKTFVDLKGKTIGQLGIGTLTYMSLFSAAEKYGMKSNDFSQVFVPFPQMGQLLASKQVDAVYAWPPFIKLIEKAGQGRVLVDDTAWTPYLVASTLGVSKSWADKNPDTVKKLVKAYIEAGRWANDHPAEARKIAAKWMKLPDDVAKDMRMLYWPRNGYVLLPSIWDQYLMMVKTGQIKPVADPAAMIDAYYVQPAQRFVAPALKELGIQPDPETDAMLKMKLRYLQGDLSKYLAPWER
jgi:ABC-type nitrate/sulfonate/bicarbonate transport system substrate-binding protein